MRTCVAFVLGRTKDGQDPRIAHVPVRFLV